MRDLWGFLLLLELFLSLNWLSRTEFHMIVNILHYCFVPVVMNSFPAWHVKNIKSSQLGFIFMHVEFIYSLPENFFLAHHFSSVKRPTKGRQIFLCELITVLLVYVTHSCFSSVFFRLAPHPPQSRQATGTYKIFIGQGMCFSVF